jgi:CheY-like chemotaxis protein
MNTGQNNSELFFNGPKALVVDDDASIRMVLRSLLRKMDFTVIEAENGLQAVQAFNDHLFDLVLMDVMMPVMDGFEAASQIKAAAGGRFVPLLFLSGAGDEENLSRGAVAGGDDYILKPPDLQLLELKVRSMERIMKLHKQIQQLYGQIEDEQKIAEAIYNKAVTTGNVALDVARSVVRPASVFSGDMVLTAYTPGRDFHGLLGDFCGHGLVAALGALPASQVFRAMSAKGFSPGEIIESINNKLYDMLPTGMFMAAQFVAVNHELDMISVCNSGMPDILVLDGKTGAVKHRIASCGLPLGVVRDRSFISEVNHLPIQNGDRVILASDGVTEATNDNLEQFGGSRFEQSLCDTFTKNGSSIEVLLQCLDDFCGRSKQHDDISMLEVPCIPQLLPEWHIAGDAVLAEIGVDAPQADIDSEDSFSLTVNGSRLRGLNPVPLVMGNLKAFVDLGPHSQVIYTILTELYLNALDHGLLQLDSDLKHDPKGFIEYFRVREERLAQLDSGHINFSIRVATIERGGCIRIVVEDSGPGFDFNAYPGIGAGDQRLYGRGIHLLKELCLRVDYHDKGNSVEAVYCWSDLSNNVAQ